MRTDKFALLAIIGVSLSGMAFGFSEPLLYDLSNHTDRELVGKTPSQSIAIYSSRNTSTGVYARNASLWTSLNLTGTTANNWGGIAISPRHIIYAAHASAGVGNEIHFVTKDNVTIRRTITAMQTAPGYTPYWPDWRIALLNEDLPASITYARFLPDDWADYLPGSFETRRFPTIGLNQFREATVQDIYSIVTSGTRPMATTQVPVDAQRLAFYRTKISGDSSSPLLMDLFGQPVVLAVWTFGGSGSGTSLTSQKSVINAVMANLGGGYQITEAQLDFPPAVLPFNIDFEQSEGYLLGAFRTTTGFVTTLDSRVVDDAFSGDQALSLTGLGWLMFSAGQWTPGYESSVTWIDFYLKPVFADANDLPAEVRSAVAAITGFVATGADGEVYAVDGDGLGGGDWTATGYSTPILDEQAVNWLRISYRLDYANKLWDLFIDGELVKADLGFADNEASPFMQFRIKGDEDKPAFLDYFYAGSDNPLYADTSGDGLPDSWLLGHGLNPAIEQRYASLDHDGISNILEFQLGLNPTNPDSDGDGIWDFREILRGANPAVPDAYVLGSVPFSDGFETDADGSLANGTRLWQIQAGAGSGVAVATAANSPEGSKQVVLSGSDASLSREFADSGQSVVWVDFQLRAQSKLVPPEGLPRDIGAVFYFAEDGTLMALNGNAQSGGTWQGLHQVADLGTGFHRITLRLDYSAQTWSIWLDDIRRGQDLGFANPVPFFSGFVLTQSSGHSSSMDAFSTAVSEPTALDNDGDGLPNAWEVLYGLDPNNPGDAILSLSGDGWTNTEKYGLGLSPGTSYLSSLPFYEPFESLSAGSLAQGDRNWVFIGASAPQIQTGEVGEGAQSLSIPSSETGVRVVNHIDGTGHKVVWTQTKLKAVPYPLGASPELAPEVSSGLFFIHGGDLRVYDGPATGWRTLALGADMDDWHTVTLRHDYTTQRWSVWVDGNLVGQNLGFAHAVSGYNQFEIEGGADVSTYADGIRVQTSLPLMLAPSVIPEWWRLQYFGTSAVDPAADPDGDGLGNLDEYLQGHIPTIADYGAASSLTTLYVDNATGSDATYNGLSASPGMPVSGYGPKATLGAALNAISSDARIIISPGVTVYTEGTLELSGRNIVLRPHGDVRLQGF